MKSTPITDRDFSGIIIMLLKFSVGCYFHIQVNVLAFKGSHYRIFRCKRRGFLTWKWPENEGCAPYIGAPGIWILLPHLSEDEEFEGFASDDCRDPLK